MVATTTDILAWVFMGQFDPILSRLVLLAFIPLDGYLTLVFLFLRRFAR
jgi:hypothetical protein